MMKIFLFILIPFIAVCSILSGLLMMANPDGGILNLQLSLLDTSPFKNYLIPGILLTTIVGGINLLAVYYNIQRHRLRYNWAIAGGITIIGWIMAQMILIRSIYWLHFIYLGIGILIILTAYQLKGKWAV